MSQLVLSTQDAHTFQLLFWQNGYEPPKSKIASEHSNLLKQAGIPQMEKSSEVIIAHLKIEQDKGGVVSFLKLAAIPVNSVSIFHVYGRDRDDKYVWRCSEGELFITNSRIIVFANSKSPDSKVIDTAWQYELAGVEQVRYEESMFVIQSNNWKEDICFRMKFPAASLAQSLSTIGDNDSSPVERYQSLEAKQDIERLKGKQLNARNILYQFFLAVIQNNQARNLRESSPKPSSEAASLLTKLGELRNAGLISEDEFNQKKREVLSRF